MINKMKQTGEHSADRPGAVSRCRIYEEGGRKVYEYESLIYEADRPGGAYVVFPYDIRKEFGRGRVKVHAEFDGEPYDGSIVNMGVTHADGSVCYILGLRRDIRARIGKQPGSRVSVTVRERE